jgi:Uma2 family endonuclease
MMNVATLDPALWAGKGLPGQDDLPWDDGEPMESVFHDAQDALLKDSLIDHYGDRRDVFVGGNMFVYFSEHQIKKNDFRGPDVFVVLDVEPKDSRRIDQKSWVAWEEGGRLPDVVIEVTSKSTARVDHGEKKRIYAQIWRTPAYFIFDPDTEKLEGFAFGASDRSYEPLVPDERGDFAVAPLGLKLGLRRTRYRNHDRNFVRWLDAEGRLVPTPGERAEQERERAEQERERAEQERERAEQERERASAALDRVHELEERLRELEAKPR